MRRLDAVEKVQRVNLPKLLKVLQRLARLEKSMLTVGPHLAAIDATIAGQVERSKTNSELLTANSHKIETIYTVLTGAQTGWGFVRKYGVKLLPFAVGVAVAKGWIAAGNGASFLHVFGL